MLKLVFVPLFGAALSSIMLEVFFLFHKRQKQYMFFFSFSFLNGFVVTGFAQTVHILRCALNCQP